MIRKLRIISKFMRSNVWKIYNWKIVNLFNNVVIISLPLKRLIKIQAHRNRCNHIWYFYVFVHNQSAWILVELKFGPVKAILRYTIIFETIPLMVYCYMHYAIKPTWLMWILTSFHNGVRETGNHYALFPKVRVLGITLSS